MILYLENVKELKIHLKIYVLIPLQDLLKTEVRKLGMIVMMKKELILKILFTIPK